MSTEDDQAWLDALAGAGPGGRPQSPAVLEALALRELIRAQPGEATIGTSGDRVPAIDARREERLIERARAAGLLPPRTAAARAAAMQGVAAQAAGAPPALGRSGAPAEAGVQAGRRRRRGGRRAALAAAVAALAAVTVLLLPKHPSETFRGTENGVVHLQA
ncbi:MAG TPA: hypothetical protein VHV81_04040, partial [Steroidobacteraceae bacterium]|nr:hypothetical protein [Steroidobacteraceae bacterium]